MDQLIARLDAAHKMIGRMCSEGRPPKMSIPARPEVDEDFVICTTLRDAQVEIRRLRGLLIEAHAHLRGRPMSQCSRAPQTVADAIKALPGWPWDPPGPPDPPPKPAHHKPFA